MQARQELILAPRLLQAIEVLELPSADLEAWLRAQAEENEALCMDPPPRESERRGTLEDSHAHDEMLRNQPDRARSLAEIVEEQLSASELPPSRLEWLRFLVGCLDERGYLTPNDEELLALAVEAGLGGGPEALGLAIADLQALEPRGIGARDAIEALLLQLDPDDEDYALLCRLLEEFLQALACNKRPEVARAMGLELSDLERLLSVLGKLNPRPAASLTDAGAPILRPDVLVLPDEQGRFQVELASGALPAVAVDPGLRAVAGDREQSSEARAYARGRVEKARAIVEAVRQRGETLLRVARKALGSQSEFLRKGPGHLRALSMTDLAAELGLHVSTVSRAVAGKYVQTPWGILPLRELFQSAAGGGERARADVAEAVRAIFEAEDARAPLSDDEVVAALAGQGIELARRTVAKYRRELGIPSSYRRRRY